MITKENWALNIEIRLLQCICMYGTCTFRVRIWNSSVFVKLAFSTLLLWKKIMNAFEDKCMCHKLQLYTQWNDTGTCNHNIVVPHCIIVSHPHVSISCRLVLLLHLPHQISRQLSEFLSHQQHKITLLLFYTSDETVLLHQL